VTCQSILLPRRTVSGEPFPNLEGKV